MKRKVPQHILLRLQKISPESQAISSITVYEVYYGAHRSSAPQHFIMLFEQLVLPAIQVIPFDETAARIAGRLRVELEQKGTPIAPADLQIAATPAATGRILVTGNTRHFAHIPGLDIENWLEVSS
ncbi:MAG: PIN domain-containing protein [Treponemataceae bacterium]|nr:PIN domain-containing protein [Treponemataceae bacterium]